MAAVTILDLVWRHSGPLTTYGPNIFLNLHIDRICTLQDIAIFIFGRVGLKLIIHAHFGGVFAGYYPLNKFRCCHNPERTVIIIFLPTSTKPRAWKLSKMLNNGCNDFLFGVHCVEEGDRIPPLQSYGQALKQKDCFSGVLGDDCGASANLLD